MNGLASLFSSVEAGLKQAAESALPTVPTSEDARGNVQVIDKTSISHSSHVSHRHKDGWLNNHDKAAQARASACAGGRAREVSSWSVGNAGTVGNARRINDLQFPPLSQEVGNIEEGGNSAPSKPALPTAVANLSPDAQAAFEERSGFLEYDCGLSRTEAERQALREMQSNQTTTRDGLALWRENLLRLGPHATPCPGYRSGEWQRVYDQAIVFLDTFGEQAEALGWTAPRLFGVHPEAGIVRVDACGGLTLPGSGQVRAITACEIRFDRSTHREKAGQPEGVPLWSVGR